MSTTTQLGKFVDLKNVQPGPFKEVYEKIDSDGIDPFQREYFELNHLHPILYENEDWFVSKNATPYDGTELHLILIHRRFITSIEQITATAFLRMQEAIDWCHTEFNFESGAFMMRFGDTSQTGASVKHLHAHIIVANKENGKRKVIIPKIYEQQES